MVFNESPKTSSICLLVRIVLVLIIMMSISACGTYTQKQEIEDLESSNANLSDDMLALETEIDTLKTSNEALLEELENAQKDTGSAQGQIGQLQASNEALNQKIIEMEETIASLNEEILIPDEDDENITNMTLKALVIVEALKNQDFETVNNYISSQGLRFVPYLRMESDQIVINQEDFLNRVMSESSYLWGYYDGSGEPMEGSFVQYYDRFIYDVDFANPHFIGVDNTMGTGGIIENHDEYYDDLHYVEFYFTGFEDEFEGMDWRSLRLYFVSENEQWLLVAIAHGQWTI